MTYLLDDRIGRATEHLELWEQILRPLDRPPVSPEMREAVLVWECDRRLAERRAA